MMETGCFTDITKLRFHTFARIMKTRLKILLPFVPIAIFCVASCHSEPKAQEQKKSIVKKPRTGDIRDSHGCLTSAGYVWSGAKDTCIRLWESGAELEPTDRSELIVYAVVADNKMKAEIVIPDDTTLLLTGSGNDTYSNDSLTLTVAGNKYSLKKNGKAIYQTGAPEQEQPKPVKKKGRRR